MNLTTGLASNLMQNKKTAELQSHGKKAAFGSEEHPKMEAHKTPSFAGSHKAGVASKLDLQA